MGIFLLGKGADIETLATEPKEVLAALVPRKEYGNPDVQEAMEKELGKWKEYDAFDEVVDEGQVTLGTRWVINRKEIHDGLKVDIKARLCLRGDKEDDKHC